MNQETFSSQLNPSRWNRRDFLKRTALCAGALGAWPALARAAKGGVNDEIGVAIIGLGDKGGQHVDLFAAAPGVRVAALCAVDPKRLAAQAAKFASQRLKPFTATDPRRVLDRADMDAVVIATPNHWHALLTLWAIRAGKDVYVEKPVSHNFQEGARMVAEAKAAGRIVQAGTQHRSCYTRQVVRPDGKIVTIYYWNDNEKTERYIAATIWTPPAKSETMSQDRRSAMQP